jgi:hypothetical protein
MPERRSLLEHAVARGGVVKGARAASVIVQWAIAERDLGHRLGEGEGLSAAVREYAEYWRMSERTAWREVSRLRGVFGEAADPLALSAALRQAMDEREIADAHAASASLRFAV